MTVDFHQLFNDFLTWVQAGHQAIMWISGATGLSAGIVLMIVAYLGRNIIKFFVKLVLVVAIVMFLISWYAGSGLPLSSSLPMS